MHKPPSPPSLAQQLSRQKPPRTPSLPPPIAAKQACDCTVWCGDDPWIASGKAQPCEARQAIIDAPRVATMKRDPENPKAVIVTFDKPPTDADLVRAYSIFTCGR